MLEEINRSGANAGACHAQMYMMGTLLRHGSESRSSASCPPSPPASCACRPSASPSPTPGSRRRSIRTRARRDGDRYVVNGQKIWTSRAAHSDLMLLLARTSEPDEEHGRWWGLSTFLVDLRDVPEERLRIVPIATMLNHSTTEVFFDDLEVPAENRIGEEGMGFRYILDGMNAERILIAAECVGDGRWFVDRAAHHARERVVFGRPIGQNQGVAFPLAWAHARIEAADLMRRRAVRALRRGREVRRGGQHGQAARRRRVLGGGERLPGHPRRRSASRASTTSSASSARRACTRWRRSRRTWCWPTSPSRCSSCRGRTSRPVPPLAARRAHARGRPAAGGGRGPRPSAR